MSRIRRLSQLSRESGRSRRTSQAGELSATVGLVVQQRPQQLAGRTLDDVVAVEERAAVDGKEADVSELVTTLFLYRENHKGIGSELFALTAAAGQGDPSDRAARRDLAAHVRDVQVLLEPHAEHEEGVIQPLVETPSRWRWTSWPRAAR